MALVRRLKFLGSSGVRNPRTGKGWQGWGSGCVGKHGGEQVGTSVILDQNEENSNKMCHFAWS